MNLPVEKINRILVIAIVMVVSLSAPSSSKWAFAQDADPEQQSQGGNIGFGIIPVGDQHDKYFEDVEIDAGETITLEVDLVNFSSIEMDFDVYITNAGSSVNGGFVAGQKEDEVMEPASWIDFTPRSVVLAANSSQRLSFEVSVPDNARPGQYISALVMTMKDTVEIPGSDVFDQRISYNISIGILVPGEIVPSFDLGEPYFMESNRSIIVPVTNTGNYLVRPTGNLVVTNSDGREVVSTEVQMGSVYSGLTSSVGIALPSQVRGGDFRISLTLVDLDSGASDEILDQPVSIDSAENPATLVVSGQSIVPNADEIVFAEVGIVLENTASQISATNVNLVIQRDGEVVDSFPLAKNQVLLSGENSYTSRYVPAESWETGTYTFRLEVFSVDPIGGTEIELLSEELDAEIIVP